MARKLTSEGFSAVIALAVVVVLAGISFAGWYVWNRNRQDDTHNNAQGKTSQANQNKDTNSSTPADPSEDGKYLVIKEWGVRVALPSDLKGKISYSLGEVMSDPDMNQIQAAKLLMQNDPAAGNECAITETSKGPFLDTAAQILRVEKGKSFNTQRYRGTFKESVLTDAEHVYHLNYVTPDCAGVAAVAQIEELQGALEQLQRVE